jgi:AAA-like domain
MGKTSLLARGLQAARDRGFRAIFTDFQKLNASTFDSIEKWYEALADSIADQLGLNTSLADTWESRRSANTNFERYLRREVLGQLSAHLVWAMDEADRLFGRPFCAEVFGLLRSWHNDRALDPTGPWSRLTMAIAYATEAQLFIPDMNQSPFNVGTRLALRDFSPAQVAELNRRCGSPLQSDEQLRQLFGLIGGHPFLVRKALNEIATHQWSFDQFEAQALSDEGIFADHLRRLLVSLTHDEALVDAARSVLASQPDAHPHALYRLQSSGVMTGESPAALRPRCRLYADYLRLHLIPRG